MTGQLGFPLPEEPERVSDPWQGIQHTLQNALHVAAPFVMPVAYLWMATQQGRNARNQIKQHKDTEEKRQNFELARLKIQILEQREQQQRLFAHQYDLQKDSQEFHDYLSNKRMLFDRTMQAERLTFEDEREKRRLFIQWCMQKDQQVFLDEQAKQRFRHEVEQAEKRFQHEVQQVNLSIAHQQELERFRQECARANLEWQFEQRQKLDWELKRYDRETQMLVCDRTRSNIEYQKIVENHPLNTYFTPILNRYRADYSSGDRPVPPLVIFSPPVIKDDPRVKLIPASEFIGISVLLELDLSDFLKTHYDLKTSTSPAYPQVASWKTKAVYLDTAETLLFDVFSIIPVIILEAGVISNAKKPGEAEERDEDLFYLRLTQWDAGDLAPSRPMGDIRLPWRTIPNLSAFLSALHRICAGLLIDEYYLVHYGVRPKLPEVLRGLVQELPNETAQQLMSLVVSRYRSILEQLRNHRPTWVPRLALELAEVLSQLPNQDWAREQVNFSVEVLESLTIDIDGEAA